MPHRELPNNNQFLVAFSFAGEQRELVRSIAEAVENRLGVSTVFLDEWFEYYLAGSDADLKLQSIYGTSARLAVLCVSKRYGEKPWTLIEHDAIRERIHKSRVSDNEKDRLGVLPIRVGDGDVAGVSFNTIIQDARNRSVNETADLIIARLGLIEPENLKAQQIPTGSPWPSEPVFYEPGLADRTGQWPAIQRLMTAASKLRILIFEGPSGYSKSTLLTAAARYARVLQIPVAYVDFKDSLVISQTNFLRRLRLDLGKVLPTLRACKEPDSWTLIEDLRDLSSPVLILLDTYEKLTESKEFAEWIENELLSEAEQCPQLRFLIGGQKTPDPKNNTRWREFADKKNLDRISDHQVWKDWIQQKNPHVDDKHVEGIVLGMDGVPANISTVLTTLAEKLVRTSVS